MTYCCTFKLHFGFIQVLEDFDTFDLCVLLKYLLKDPFLCPTGEVAHAYRSVADISAIAWCPVRVVRVGRSRRLDGPNSLVFTAYTGISKRYCHAAFLELVVVRSQRGTCVIL